MALFEMVFFALLPALLLWICSELIPAVQRMIKEKLGSRCEGKLTRHASLSKSSNKEIYENLKNHKEYGPFFRRQKYELVIHYDSSLGEGGQGGVFKATGTVRGGNCTRSSKKLALAVKIFPSGYSLEDLQTQWPGGLLKTAFKLERPKINNRSYFPCLPLGATVSEDDRFAFVFPRYEGDLRSLINSQMSRKGINYNGPPFSPSYTFSILHKIAKGMAMLHNLGFLHKDLKAANILYPPGEQNRCDASDGSINDLHIADFESSAYTVGTAFWRAPEILLQLKKKIPSQSLTFTRQADVWSYGMTCYEVLTGHSPFEGHSLWDTDFVIQGARPSLPDDIYPGIGNLVRSCWHEDPLQRLSFEAIVRYLEHIGPKCNDPRDSLCERKLKSNGRSVRVDSANEEVVVKNEQNLMKMLFCPSVRSMAVVHKIERKKLEASISNINGDAVHFRLQNSPLDSKISKRTGRWSIEPFLEDEDGFYSEFDGSVEYRGNFVVDCLSLSHESEHPAGDPAPNSSAAISDSPRDSPRDSTRDSSPSSLLNPPSIIIFKIHRWDVPLR